MPGEEVPADDGEGGLGRAFVALRYPDFRRFWLAAVVSNTGSWVQGITVPFVLYTLTRRGVWVGMASFAQFAPFVVAGPLGGSLADRLPRRTLLLLTHGAALLSAASLALAWTAGLRSPTAIVALVAVGGLAAGLGSPAWQAFVTDLVPRSVLLNAISLNSAQFNAARAFGPALGGIVLATLGAGWAFSINALSYLSVILALARIRAGRARPTDPVDDRPGVLREFAASVLYIRTQRGIAACVLTVVGLSLLTSPVSSLLVVFAEAVFEVGRGRYGLLVAAIGLGAVLATPYVSSRHPERPRGPFVGAALGANALAAAAFALAPSYWFGLVALLIMGAAYLAVAGGRGGSAPAIGCGAGPASGVAAGGQRTPATRRPRAVDGLEVGSAPAQLDEAGGRADHPGRSRPQQGLGDRLGHEAAGVEVVGGDQAGRRAQPERLEDGIEPQVVEMAGGEASGLEIDDHLAGDEALGPLEGEVGPTHEHDVVAVQLDPPGALGDGPPRRLQRRPGLEELGHLVVDHRPQLGPFDLGQLLQPVGKRGLGQPQPGDGLVDQAQRLATATRVGRQLDGLVGHGTARQRHRPAGKAG